MSKRLFSIDIQEKLRQIVLSVNSLIENETEDYILNVNEETYIDHLNNKHQLDIPVLNLDDVSVDTIEKEFEIHDRYGERERWGGDNKVTRQVFKYYIPYSGNRELLYYKQANVTVISGFNGEGTFDDGCLVLEVPNHTENVENVKNQYDRTVKEIIDRYTPLVADIKEFNDSLSEYVSKKFRERKEKILHQKNQLASLGVPVRKKNVPGNYAVPTPNIPKQIVPRPIVTEKGFKPEPELTDEDHNEILRIISSAGKSFESLPNIYSGKGEEDLRDHILLSLTPHFGGSTTGESFNKTGKTDIMLNHQGHPVFIGECKFWSGEKKLLETITQLLGYLTWRNSKASVIIFAEQQDFSAILEKVKKVVPTHPNYLGFIGESNVSWFNYRFHINGDKNREVKLAIQLFHIPKIK